MALIFWLLLALFWGGGRLFELQEAIEELQSENMQLQGKIQNLTEALSELRLFVWNRSQGSDSTSEHLLHEHVPCHPESHQRNTAVSCVLESPACLFAAMLLVVALSKVIG